MNVLCASVVLLLYTAEINSLCETTVLLYEDPEISPTYRVTYPSCRAIIGQITIKNFIITRINPTIDYCTLHDGIVKFHN